MTTMPPFVPDSFVPPTAFDAAPFHFHKLTPRDVQNDYAAVIAARDFIRALYEIDDPNEWPTPDITIEQDADDLKRHETQFDSKEAFAYTVMDTGMESCLGCVYIDPSESPEWDAMVTLWGLNRETTDRLYTCVRKFVDEHFPFERPCFPVYEVPLCRVKEWL